MGSPLRCLSPALLLLLGLSASTQAAIFVVDRSDDTAAAAAQACSAAANDCSLRGAIIKANGTAAADEIQFAPALDGVPLTLTLAGDDDLAAVGDLDVNASLTITGRGAANTIIQAGTDATNGIDKVLALNPTCAVGLDFTITGVTVRFGRNTVAHDLRFQDTGGGIDWCGAGTGANEPTLVLTDSVIDQNSTLKNSAGDTGHYGGGLNIDEVAPSNGVVTITNTVFSNNQTAAWGAGINIFGDNVRVTITGATFTGNQTLGTGGLGGSGGGMNIRITNKDDGDGAPTPFVDMSNSIVSNNQSAGSAAGVCVTSGPGIQNVTITDTVITGNQAHVNVVTAPRGGGMLNASSGPTVLERVLIAGNHAEGGLLSEGGGLANEGTNLVVKNSTISGNRSQGDGGGFLNVVPTAAATFTNVTITANRADTDDDGNGTGGGVQVLSGTVTLHNSIVAENFHHAAGTLADDVAGTLAAASSFDLIDTGGSGGLTDGVNGNQVGVANPLLAPLGSYGAAIAALQTHALLPGSRAINAGSNAAATAAGLTTDQRGIVRPQQTTVDVGAYESRGFALAKNGGDNQMTNIFTVFPAALAVAVTANAPVEPVDGGQVTFTPPGPGASATLTPNPTTIAGGQASPTATANGIVGIYNVAADARGSAGPVSFTLRNTAPDLTAAKADDVGGGPVRLGNGWIWTLTEPNGGDGPAVFAAGQTILVDSLPNSGISYGLVTVIPTGVTGTITCSITSSDLSCVAAAGGVSIAPGGGFQASFGATPSTVGTFANPRAGGSCAADSGAAVPESNEANNACNADSVVVIAPDLTVSKTNTVSGAVALGNPWDWRITAANAGTASADFTSGETIFTDTLPATNVSYGAPSIGASSGVTGTIVCALVGGNVLSCAASGAVSIAAPGSFRVDVTATPSGTGTFANPTGGPCRVDPNGNQTESNEGNNDCNVNTVTVTAPDLTAVKANTVSGATTLGNTWDWRVTVANGGNGPAGFGAGQTIFTDTLPATNVSYGAVSIGASSGITGTILCGVAGGNVITCTASGAVSIAAAGSVRVDVTATPSAVGTFTNPTGGPCQVDPNDNVAESNDANNACNADSVTVTAPDLTVAKTNTTGGATTLGNTWDWRMTASNGGNAAASYAGGQTIFTDTLPATNVSYGVPSIGAASGLTGTIVCALGGGNVVTCTASGAVSIAAPGSFRVDVTATPSASGTFTNPTGGPCRADPNDNITESDEANNACNADSVTVNAPDLTVVKANTVGGATTLGNTWDWRATVSNGGNAAAGYASGQTIFTDTLPATNVSYGAPSIGASAGITGTVVCALGGGNLVTCTASGAVSIAAPGSFRVDVTATPSAGGTFTNPTGGPCRVDPNDDVTENDEANNACNSDSVTVSAPDLTVVKANTVGGASTLGNAWDWRMTVSNGGNAAASFASGQTIFTDTLPATNVTYGPPSIGAASGVTGAILCALGGGNVITCTASGAVSVAAPGSFRVDVTATPSAGGTFTNPTGGPCRVDPDGNVTESDETNDLCNSDSVGVDAPDLVAVKTNSVGGATNLGSAWDWQTTVSNGGSGAAVYSNGQTIFTDTLPSTGVSYGSPSIGASAGITGAILCALGGGNVIDCTASGAVSIAAAGSFRVDVTATPSTGGTFTSPTGGPCEADPGHAVAESNEGNNACNSDSVTVSAADLTAVETNTVGGATTLGNSWDWRVTVSNGGNAPASFTAGQTIFTDTLPATNVSYGAPAIGASAGVTGTISCALVGGNVVSCLASGAVTIAPAGSVRVDVTATPSANGSFTNPTGGPCQVDPGDAVHEGNEANNACNSDTVAVGSPRLSATKTVSGSFTVAGTVTYTIVISNSGTAAAPDGPGAELTDALPAALTLTSAGASSGTASTGANTVTWNGSVPAGGSVTVTITATIDAGTEGTTISNQGTVAYDADLDGSNETTVQTDDPAAAGATDPTTLVVAAAAAVEIPALSRDGLFVLLVGLALVGAWILRRAG